MGFFQGSAIAMRIVKALAGKRGAAAEASLRIELRRIFDELDPATAAEARRLIQVAVEEANRPTS